MTKFVPSRTSLFHWRHPPCMFHDDDLMASLEVNMTSHGNLAYKYLQEWEKMDQLSKIPSLHSVNLPLALNFHTLLIFILYNLRLFPPPPRLDDSLLYHCINNWCGEHREHDFTILKWYPHWLLKYDMYDIYIYISPKSNFTWICHVTQFYLN